MGMGKELFEVKAKRYQLPSETIWQKSLPFQRNCAKFSDLKNRSPDLHVRSNIINNQWRNQHLNFEGANGGPEKN